MNAQFDPKKVSNAQPILLPENANDFLESASLHTEGLLSALTTICSSYGEGLINHDETQALLFISQDIAGYMIEDLNKAAESTSTDLSALLQKASGIRIAIRELSKLRMHERYNCGFLNSLCDVVEKFKDQINDKVFTLVI